MKKLVFGSLAALVLVFSLTAGTVLAAEAPTLSNSASSTLAGPFEGVFYGVIQGDNNSRAPIALQMTHRDGVVNGRLYLGNGLFVDAGRCGKTQIPSMAQSASGRTHTNNLALNTTFNVSGFDIGANLNSSVSADGNTLSAKIAIDLPWLCGRDPSYSGMLQRVQ